VNQAGLFEQARGGTLFLDEIHSMPVPMQTKLLRVLQEKKVRRVGSLESVQVACRIISAMNEEPEQLIREGKLRQDLYYRLAGVSLNIPPLRERRLDIMPITTFFINRYNAKLNRVVKNVAKDLVDFIFTYRWPGNIRELEHVIENIMIRASGEQEEIGLADIPDSLRHVLLGPSRRDGPAARPAALPSQLRDLERERILASLERNRWNFTQAARDLGIIRQSLDYRMKKLGIGKKTAP
jgi:arginine utilization regulatory protein